MATDSAAPSWVNELPPAGIGPTGTWPPSDRPVVDVTRITRDGTMTEVRGTAISWSTPADSVCVLVTEDCLRTPRWLPTAFVQPLR